MRKNKCFFLIFFVFTLSCVFDKKENVVSPEINKVPDAPTNVSFSPGDSRITISWTNISNAKSYNVYMHTESGITKNNYSKKYKDAEKPFLVTNLTNATTYYFCVVSVNEGGESELSGEVSCTPKMRGTPWMMVFPETAGIKKDETQQFEIIYFNEAGEYDPSVIPVWMSHDTTIAKINSSGLAEAVSVGITSITATVKEKKSSAILEVLPEIIGTALNFTLSDLDGNSVSLADFSGKVIILDFWASWCPSCRAEIPHFVELYNTYKDEGLVIIGVAVDPSETPDILKPFADQYGITYPLLLGTEPVADLYGGIQYIPTTFIIDRNNNIIREYVGYKDKAVWENEILKLL